MIGIACWVCFLWQLQSQASSLSVAITPNDVLNEFTEQKSHKKPSRLEKLSLDNRPDIIQGKVAPRDLKHKVVIVRKQNNLPLLERMLMDVSNPKSAKYGKHLTKSQISKITSNNGATVAIKEFLLGQGILEINSTRYDDYIIAEAPISEWERILSAQFYEFEHINVKGKKFVRSMQYTIPPSLEDHVAAIFNTVQLPDHHFGKRLKFEPRPQSVSTMASGSVVPSLLNSFYNIGSNTGNNLTDQAVYAILDQTLSPSDLATFQQQFGLPLQPIASEVGGRVDDNACSLDINDCMEANLDVQYVMAVAQAVPTIYYYWTGNDVWLDWIVSVADLEDPPDLFTISYGSYEIAFDPEYLEAFKNEAIKLGLAGTTLLAASGDDGVAGFQARSGGGVPCGYYASFPASCPYVTAVGGTMVCEFYYYPTKNVFCCSKNVLLFNNSGS